MRAQRKATRDVVVGERAGQCRWSGGSARAILGRLHGDIRFGPFRQLGEVEQVVVVEAAGGLALVLVPPVRPFKGDAVKRAAFPGGIRPDRGAERTDFHGVDGTGLVNSGGGRPTDLQEKGIGTLSDIRRSAKKGKDNFFRAGGYGGGEGHRLATGAQGVR